MIRDNKLFLGLNNFSTEFLYELIQILYEKKIISKLGVSPFNKIRITEVNF